MCFSIVLVRALGRCLLLIGFFAVGQLKVLSVAVKRQIHAKYKQEGGTGFLRPPLRHSHMLLPLLISCSHAGKQLPVSLVGVLRYAKVARLIGRGV